MSWNVTTGLDTDQLDVLVARVHRVLVEDPDPPLVSGRMWALGLYKSVVLVLFLLRQNPVQEAAAELFGICQATVSRRWTALLPVVEKALTCHVPDPAEASAGRIVLVDGTLVTTWDWASEGTTMFSGKHRATGFNLQVAATLAGDLLAVSAPVPGSRHDMHAWRLSGFPDTYAQREGIGDLGYVGSGLLTPRRKPPGQERSAGDTLAALATQFEIRLSVGRTGQCWDNALAESFFSTLKNELGDTHPWPTRAAAHTAIFEWIESWYNLHRLHSSLGYRSPAEYETALAA